MRQLVLFGLITAIQLYAADPRVGSWTLISAQSSLDPPRKLSIAPLQNGVHVAMPDQHLDFDAKWDGREAPVKDESRV